MCQEHTLSRRELSSADVSGSGNQSLGLPQDRDCGHRAIRGSHPTVLKGHPSTVLRVSCEPEIEPGTPTDRQSMHSSSMNYLLAASPGPSGTSGTETTCLLITGRRSAKCGCRTKENSYESVVNHFPVGTSSTPRASAERVTWSHISAPSKIPLGCGQAWPSVHGCWWKKQ